MSRATQRKQLLTSVLVFANKRMEAQKEGLIALSAKVRENKTLFAKTINDYHN